MLTRARAVTRGGRVTNLNFANRMIPCAFNIELSGGSRGGGACQPRCNLALHGALVGGSSHLRNLFRHLSDSHPDAGAIRLICTQHGRHLTPRAFFARPVSARIHGRPHMCRPLSHWCQRLECSCSKAFPSRHPGSPPCHQRSALPSSRHGWATTRSGSPGRCTSTAGTLHRQSQ